MSSLEKWKEGLASMGGLPLALLFFVPRTSMNFMVISVAMACRALARLLQTASGYKRKANLRILIVTDYMPPQTHGIAIRFRQYIDYMRKAGHEVQVFCTDMKRESESSFDHPNLPSIVNPYNLKNRTAYSSGAHTGCAHARAACQDAQSDRWLLPACVPASRAQASNSRGTSA